MAAPPETLEALVRDELRGPVSKLVEKVVRELVREQLNGGGSVAQAHVEPHQAPSQATDAPVWTSDTSGPSTKVCTICGERPRATNRTVCTRCLERGKRERRAERERAAAERDSSKVGGEIALTAAEEPVPFAGSAPG